MLEGEFDEAATLDKAGKKIDVAKVMEQEEDNVCGKGLQRSR
jgi:hypothetical protein